MATTRLGLGGYPVAGVGGLPPREGTIDQLVPDFSQVFEFEVVLQITYDHTIPPFTQTVEFAVTVQLSFSQTIPAFNQVLHFGTPSELVFDQTIPDFPQTVVFNTGVARDLVFDQQIPPFRQLFELNVDIVAAGGGGGGAPGIFGKGEDGQPGRSDGVGGYGGAGDNYMGVELSTIDEATLNSLRQVTPSAAGHTGTEWDQLFGSAGSGSGGAGGDWAGLHSGVAGNGGTGGTYGAGGGGGGGGLISGSGALGGEGLIFIRYYPDSNGSIIFLLDKDGNATRIDESGTTLLELDGLFTFPDDWVDHDNTILILGAGGCGADGRRTKGGDGGGGGGLVGVYDTTLYSPGETIAFSVPSAQQVCDDPSDYSDNNTVFGDYEAAPGQNGDGTGGGEAVPFDSNSGGFNVEVETGLGGPGGEIFIGVDGRGAHVLIVAG